MYMISGREKQCKMIRYIDKKVSELTSELKNSNLVACLNKILQIAT